MKLYTGKGDTGQTDLLGERVGKSDPRIDLIGELDETTSSVGFARALSDTARLQEWLIEAQRDLYKIMAELAFTDELRPDAYAFAAERVEWLEQITDLLSSEIALAPEFILPGGTVPSGALDVSRAVVRRAERRAAELAGSGYISNDQILRYLNRLSSFLFMAARLEESVSGVEARKART